jgi:DNA-binding NarL/FixJ family response regulator
MRTVAVIDDHPIYRDGLAQAIVNSGEFALSGTYDDVAGYLSDAPTADLVLLDYHLASGPVGPKAVSVVVDRGSAVLMVSADIGKTAVLDTLAAGARGYVAKHAPVEEILTAIRLVSDPDSPGSYVSPSLASYMLDADQEPGTHRLQLSQREREVLALVAAGERDQDIAELLCISIGTVRSHLDHIRTKTGHRRRADLTRLAFDQDLASPPSS